MALVAYDNSDSSEYEEEDEPAPITTITLNKKKEEPATILQPQNDTSESIQNYDQAEQSQSLFNHLPQPSHKRVAVVEEDDEFLHKKETPADIIKPKSKITVPSLSDFKDVKDTVLNARPKVSNGKKSGLLSILPQPRNSSTSTSTKSLIPHVLTQKPQASTAKKKEIPSHNRNSKVASKKPSTISQFSDDSDNEDDGIQNDFFSIHKPVEALPPEELPLDLEQPSSSKVKNTPAPRTLESYFKQETIENHVEEEHNMEESNVAYAAQTSNYAAPTVSSDIALDEEAILKLCGTRGKRKREDIQIVEVNQQEVLADAREWLLKGLMDDTSKRVSASKKRGNEPTNQQKRKHQITYLAHQAKANEVELQNQWANNRMTKRQTQSKYGF